MSNNSVRVHSSTNSRDRLLFVATVVGGAGLAAVVPDPRAVLRTLAGAEAGPVGPQALDAAALAVAGAIVWGLIGWTLLIAVLALLARGPGVVGRSAHRVLRRVAPGFVRRVVIAGMGVTVLTGAAACSTDGSVAGPRSDHPVMVMAAARVDHVTTDDRLGTAVRGVPSPAASVRPMVAGAAADRVAGDVDLDWPVDRPTGTAPRVDVDWPAPVDPAPTRTAPQKPVRDAAHRSTVVVVEPGDSLWRIAAAQLGPGARDEQIDAAWRSWFAANRDVIGSDPDLIEPGQRLHPPATVDITTDGTPEVAAENTTADNPAEEEH